MTRRRGTVAAIAALVCAIVLSGCSQERRQRMATDIARSLDRTPGRVEVGTVTFTVRPVRLPGGEQFAAQARGGTIGSLGVAVDAGDRRAAFTTPADGHVVALFEPTTAFVRRRTKSPADKRLWSRLDLVHLPDISLPTFAEITRGTAPGDVVVLDPVFLTDLLAGVLTGSVKQQGVDDAGNRRLVFNTSISKAQRKRHVDESERKSRTKLLRSLAITDDIHSGEVVLRPDGSLAGVKIVLSERPDKQTRLDLEARLVLDAGRGDRPKPDLSSPGRDVSVRVPALGTLKGTLTDQLMPQGQPPSGGLAGAFITTTEAGR